MRTLKIILSAIVIVICLGLVTFAGIFLFSALPREKSDQPETSVSTDPPVQEETPAETPSEPETSAPDAPTDPEVPADTPEEPEQSEDAADELAGHTARIQNYLAGMTLDEKIWQLFFTTPESLTGVTTATQAGDTTKAALAERPVGGLCYFAANLVDAEQTKTMLENTQSYAKTPLFLGVDEEGGRVSRAGSNPAMGVTHFEAAAVYGQRADMAEVYQVGSTLAQELGALGFNLDFAPVADVVTNPNNTEIGDRSYSSDPQVAGAMVSAMVDGLQRGNMVSCLKHFPGHGSTETDTHEGKSVSNRTLEELQSCEWVPFQAGIDKGAAMVMLSHLTNENLSDLPSDLSPEVVSHLREDLGFQGIIITDSHQMGAITDYYDSGEAAVLALQAGVDMILMPMDLQAAFNGIKAAVEAGTLTEACIDESVTRILTVKYGFGILNLSD